MKNDYTIITLTDEDIKNHPFITKEGNAGFYRFIAEKFVPYDQIQSIDCRKVNTAKNIQESWFHYASEVGIAKDELAMMLLFNGPKALEHLEDNQVELEEGAIEW